MLQTWAKRIPRSMDKAEVLCDALAAVGRYDLMDEIKEKEYEYKEQRAQVLQGRLCPLIKYR